MVKKWKVLNLYAGIGGNRKLWKNVDVTAVEWDRNTARIYSRNFPNDEIIVTDAHKYLKNKINDSWDFIWSSPPCPTHSRIRKCFNTDKPVYPDMKLYEEIIFLKGYFKGKWCVENVRTWYKPLIQPQDIGLHYFWANFIITPIKVKSREHFGTQEELEKRKGFSLKEWQGEYGVDNIKTLRNCVEPELGKHILNCARKKTQKTLNIILS